MTPARNLRFTYAEEEPKRAGDVLAGPRDLRSARAAGSERHCCLPSGAAPRRLRAPRGPPRSLRTLWPRAKSVGKGSGQLLFAQSKHLWRTVYACVMLTRLPAIRETLHPREVLKHTLTPPPKYVQISPLVPRRHSLLLLSHPQQQKIILHYLTMQRHTKTF